MDNFKPIYLISSDVPLLTQEARDKIIARATLAGFSEKIILQVGIDFSDEKLQKAISNRQLFSEKKIIDIRNPSAKWDKETITTLERFLQQNATDICIIISTDKLTTAQQKSAWVTMIKKQGTHLMLWPVGMEALPQWIVERAATLHLQIPIPIARFLAQFTEGNLLSTQQALLKLQLLYPKNEITQEKLNSVLIDQARFHIFDLSNALQHRDAKKTVRVLARLKQMDEEPTLVLWAMSRTIREYASCEILLKKALTMAAKIDRIIKGVAMGDAWQGMTSLGLLLCTKK
ncbi:MAG: DNA polymerase III subunit delta [Gammaproteobacteria bacterium RIFCSPLOWO2_02_FULL_42_14]|nr:MAG: DNA polymerase III subunit delta [Gammaproteobacteria bacterium RIFCSPHIGHO2_02_FULL_42_43]OGT28652.1 MAG: DNA polymerase III subunit delta [Gammaproteobacteria bacterium RIFCSPHIGHO2_01_FULL_42_8]OGT52921.1 MAG: DNA polymerase III subunit delta [Gammaproteobacteria bacterium RIFCSPHIGHO2_12_FULL_41_25]OGT61305.1 MAG: DNA polymerase III subunit delta [Gammaproteobacteria bacterium RIFCSPLOWO2_02_FULL_42_14]OGT87234.1 MAG: DNA polymerase III subunit delta [Gammaproteobacteria bacterium R